MILRQRFLCLWVGVETWMESKYNIMGMEKTGTFIEIPEDKEEIDMCEAWKGIMEDCRAEGRTEGILEGKAEGRKEGEAKILSVLIRNGLLDLETAALHAEMSEAELSEIINKLS